MRVYCVHLKPIYAILAYVRIYAYGHSISLPNIRCYVEILNIRLRTGLAICCSSWTLLLGVGGVFIGYLGTVTVLKVLLQDD